MAIQENLTKLKDQIKVLMDAATDKEQISKLASVNDTITAVEADTTALQKEQVELLNSYKDVVKHASFGETKEPERGGTTPKSFEEVLAEYKAKKKKN